MRSIRRNLLFWLFAGILAGIVAAGSLLYQRAREEANTIFDYQMQQMAAALPRQAFAPVPPSRLADPDFARDIIIQIWDDTGLRIYHSHQESSLPQRARLGFSDVIADGGAWRVYSTQLGGTIVQVAQPLSIRRKLAADMALRTVMPLLLLFPFLGALAWIVVSRGLLPVRRVAREVQARDASALTPIRSTGLPEEIQPLAQALNELLGRLGKAIDTQRAFIADAAHELRTPLTALKLHIQLAERAADEHDRKTAFATLNQSFERTMHLVQQLLTLARHEPGAVPKDRIHVDLAPLLMQTVAELAPIAAARHIDLGIDRTAPVVVPGEADGLYILLRNLIDNAVRYTPDGGTVDVSLTTEGRQAVVEVQDSGPGIPAADLQRVFDRFYRVSGTGQEGSGLGLAIVREIAQANGIEVTLENMPRGLRARLVFDRLETIPSV